MKLHLFQQLTELNHSFDELTWKDQCLGTYEGYLMVKQALDSLDRCEPKFDLFPYKPILCRRWWMPNHQTSCGHVSKAAIDFARGYGKRKQA